MGYAWTSLHNQGLKFPVEEKDQLTGFLEKLVNQQVEPKYDCKDWTPEDAVFELPPNIKFAETTAQTGKKDDTQKIRTNITALDALLGPQIGLQISQYMDQGDEDKAQQALEYNRKGILSTWHSLLSNDIVTVTPVRTYYEAENVPCRDYQTSIHIRGKVLNARGTACRNRDGVWKQVKK